MLLGIVLDMKSLVVDMMFLSEWGEQLVNPYLSSSADQSSESNDLIITAWARGNDIHHLIIIIIIRCDRILSSSCCYE